MKMSNDNENDIDQPEIVKVVRTITKLNSMPTQFKNLSVPSKVPIVNIFNKMIHKTNVSSSF